MTQPIRREGHGADDRDPLLLVHGLGATRRVWEPVAKALEDSFEVLAPTLLGHFEAEPFPYRRRTADRCAGRLARAPSSTPSAGTAHISPGTRWAAGSRWSWQSEGGRALSWRWRRPEAGGPGVARSSESSASSRSGVRSGGRSSRTPNGCAGRRSAGGSSSVSSRNTPSDSSRPTRCTASARRWSAPSTSTSCAPDGSESAHGLDQIRCPVLLAWPAKDRVLPFRRYGRPLCEALPSAELRMLHDVGHVPMLDDPSGIAHLVRDFIMRAAGAAQVHAEPAAVSSP